MVPRRIGIVRYDQNSTSITKKKDPSDRLAKPVFKKRDEGYEFQVGRP